MFDVAKAKSLIGELKGIEKKFEEIWGTFNQSDCPHDLLLEILKAEESTGRAIEMIEALES